MIKRELGRSGLMVGPLAFGGNVFGWTADQAMSHRLLDAFVDAGLNLVDTADVYMKMHAGNRVGQSEEIIGAWLAQGGGRRDKIVLATKVGIEMAPGESGLSKAYILREVEQSLRRLRTDRIDLYQSHRDDPATPVAETLEAYAALIRQGKVRAIGASNFSVERLGEALRLSREAGLPRYESYQPWYNLYDRDKFEGPEQELCRRENVGVISYFSLASGFLTGKYRKAGDLEGRARAYRVKDMMDARGMRILAALDEVAAAARATPAQVSLAWLVAHGVAAPIASATRPEQLAELIGAANLTLSADAVARLDAASA
ncbi:MAG TPA: aldo/keto reductase [Hyphomicrobiales bacterium]|nr:aldo/keto reductase [Hyphomicrobiales bacterium]